jgi:hypothetical protein
MKDMETLRQRLELTEREVIAVRLENEELKKQDRQSEAIKELERLSRDYKDNQTKYIVLQTQHEDMSINFEHTKKLMESIKYRLDETSSQTHKEKILNKRLTQELNTLEDIKRERDD